MRAATRGAAAEPSVTPMRGTSALPPLLLQETGETPPASPSSPIGLILTAAGAAPRAATAAAAATPGKGRVVCGRGSRKCEGCCDRPQTEVLCQKQFHLSLWHFCSFLFLFFFENIVPFFSNLKKKIEAALYVPVLPNRGGNCIVSAHTNRVSGKIFNCVHYHNLKNSYNLRIFT